jgi:hypothetical protein
VGGSIIGTVVSLFVGTAVAGATVVGVISSQTSAPESSPADVNESSVIVEYGSN